MEDLKHVPDNMVLNLFKGVSEFCDHLPTDKDILSYFRLKLADKKSLEGKPMLEHRVDVAYLLEVKAMNPNFSEFIDKLISDPQNLSKEEKSKFWAKLGDPKYFKKNKNNLKNINTF